MSAVNGVRFNVASTLRDLLLEYPNADASRLWELCIERGMDGSAVSRNGFRVACSIAKRRAKGGDAGGGDANGGDVDGGDSSVSGSDKPRAGKQRSVKPRKAAVSKSAVSKSLVPKSGVVEESLPAVLVSLSPCDSDRVRLAADFLCACGYDLAIGKSLLDVVSELRVLWVGDSVSGGPSGPVPL